MPANVPSSIDALTQAAMAALAGNRPEQALDYAARARAAAPGNAFAHLNEAVALRALRRLDQAAQAVAEARRLAPTDAAVAYNLALIELSRGNWTEGWRFLDTRLALPRRRAFRFADRAPPPWRGEDLSGRSLLIRWEEGFGDTIQMLRYVRPLAERGCAVHLDVQKPLLELVRVMPVVAAACGSDGDQPVTAGDVEFSLPALSLPRRMDERLAAPCPPYLAADAGRVSRWAARLAELPRPWWVVQWQGSRAHALDHVRSVPVAAVMAALAGQPGSLVSVQKGAECPPDVLDLGAELADFADSAAILSLADQILSVDTAVAHLAGALGRRAHVLLAVNADWRWLAPQAGQWYPTLSLHHQTTAGDWTEPLAAAVAALGTEAEAARISGPPAA